jgi:hypothetical protein
LQVFNKSAFQGTLPAEQTTQDQNLNWKMQYI